MDEKKAFCAVVTASANLLKNQKGIQCEPIKEETLRVEIPPKPEMGDLGCPCFVLAKMLKMSPQNIAQELCKIINNSIQNGESLGGENLENLGIKNPAELGEYLAVGPYVNIKLNKSSSALKVLKTIHEQKMDYGSFDENGKKFFEGQRVMVEYSSPNTNKPLHLGHMRNDALGESVSRILKKAGAEVFRVNIINNRGIHICKSMLAYKLFHEAKGETPQSLGIKGDHFVGQCYVEFDKYSKEHPEALDQAQKMLEDWENGNPNDELHALWQKMNSWAIDGIKETYKRTGVGFEKIYYESETYLKGKEEIQKGLEQGIFFKATDGSVRIDVTEVTGKGKNGENQEKVLLRKDGTSVYITQDIGTAIYRHSDWAFNQMVYVVASEQIYHFKVLFYILKKLGFSWAEKLYHLSYGLVNLPSGRMKSREGTVVDADDLIDSLHSDALKAISEKGRDEQLENPDDVAEKVALSALHYYLLNVSPSRDMLFNPQESLSFNGNTGPYLQYMGARISSIIRKAKEKGLVSSYSDDDLSLLSHESEWSLIKDLQRFPNVVLSSAQNYDPSQMAAYLYDVAKSFSSFYRDCSILNEENKNLAQARLSLAESTLVVLKNGMDLVLVPFLEKM